VNYVVATIKSWNLNNFASVRPSLPGNWTLITHKDDLVLENLRKLRPRYIFFPHWSWIVPPEIISEFECVCFHMTDLPYGRGGTPLQNLILDGKEATKISALRMTSEIDAGPIYMKQDLSLSGSAEEILKRASLANFAMLKTIVETEPVPSPQVGAVVNFRRRTPDQSNLVDVAGGVGAFYDFIRMLDGEGYPKAFFDIGDVRVEFHGASRGTNEVLCKARFHERKRP
jgi:methionyl-tRNA formyltransferase